MNPQRADQDPRDQDPKTRPQLRVVPGSGQSTPRAQGHLSEAPAPSEEKGAGDSSASLRALEGGGATTPRAQGHLKSVDSDDLKSGEDDAVNYTGDEKKRSKQKKIKGKQWWTKKKAGVAGGILGIGMAGGIFGLSIISGPFEIIHIAQLMQHAHFSNQTDASDARMGKLYRWINSGGDASETRLGWLASKYKGTMLGQLSDKGISPATGRFATLDGWNVDTAAGKNNPFKDMSAQEIHDYLIQEGVPEGAFSVSDAGGGKFSIVPEKGGFNFLKSYSNQKDVLQFMVGQMDESKIPNGIRWRILGKAFGITWHPLQKLKGWFDGTVNDAALKIWSKARGTELKTGEGGPDNMDATKAKEQNKNAKGKTTTTPENGGTVDTPGGFSKGLTSIKNLASSPGGKVAGGLAAAIGIVCLFKTVSNNIGDIRYAQAIVPMMRLGAETVIEGEQIMMGKDVDLSEMGVIAQQFYDSQQKLDWSDSQPIQADSGEATTGQDVSQEVKDTVNETPPSWLSWTDNSVVGGICSTGGQIVTGVVSFALGIFSGGAASTVLQAVAGYLVAPHVIKYLTELATNNIVDVTKVVGPQFGGVVDYGSAFWSSEQAAGTGATVMSPATVAALNNMNNQEYTQQFEHENLAYRLFNPADDRSLVSNLIDNSAPTPQGNAMHLADAFMGLGHTLASLPMNLFSSVVHADSKVVYNYPFSVWGFTPQDMTSPLVANPFTNAGVVGKLLDNNNTNGEGDYIGHAQTCFGVAIQKNTETDGTQDWDVVPNGQGINLYNNTQNTSDYYPAADCANPTDPGITKDNWLRLRFFVFDTGEFEGYACEHGDSTSCQNDGVDQNQLSQTSYLSGSDLNPTTPSPGMSGGFASDLQLLAGALAK